MDSNSSIMFFLFFDEANTTVSLVSVPFASPPYLTDADNHDDGQLSQVSLYGCTTCYAVPG